MTAPERRSVHIATVSKTYNGKTYSFPRTERQLEPIRRSTRRKTNSLRDKENIGLRSGKVISRHKMAKHFELTITDDSFTYSRREEKIAAEAILDGLYVVRTSVEAELISWARTAWFIRIIDGHQLPHFILVQPDRVGVSSYEIVDVQTFDLLRPQNSFLHAIDEDRHVFLFPLPPRPLFGGRQFAFLFWHVASFPFVPPIDCRIQDTNEGRTVPHIHLATRRSVADGWVPDFLWNTRWTFQRSGN